MHEYDYISVQCLFLVKIKKNSIIILHDIILSSFL